MILAALEVVTGEQKEPLVVTGRKLLASIPDNYPGNRRRVSLALLEELRPQYDDPEASAKIDAALTRLKSSSSVEVDQLLQELINHKTTAQQVLDLARAVSGQTEKTGIEERGDVVVIGGVRVRVKK
jgi:hypothetical protein